MPIQHICPKPTNDLKEKGSDISTGHYTKV